MKRKYLTLYTFIVLIVWSCNSNQFDPEVAEEVIVEAYLYSDLPANEIRISRLIPFSTSETSFEIDDARVLIAHQGLEYELVNQGEGKYINESLRIQEGEHYELKFEYFDKLISAQTAVPEKPKNLSISVDEIEIAPISSFLDLRDRDFDQIEVYWDNPEGKFFYLLVENIESFPAPIDENGILEGFTANFEFVIPPTNLDVSNIRPQTLSHYGTYRVILFSVNQEYVDLYETAEQDSRNLTEPSSNVQNGLGIFTAFNSDTTYFRVKRP